MRFILFSDYAAANAADLRAFAFLKTDDNARGAQWSGVFTDGTRWGILHDPDIEGGFTALELANSAIGNLTERDISGNITTPGWDRYTPPAPPPEVLP